MKHRSLGFREEDIWKYVRGGSARVAVGMLVTVLSAVGAVTPGAEGLSDGMAQARWRESISKLETPSEGCFQASFPSAAWERTSCQALSLHTHPVPRKTQSQQRQQTAGNGNDYALVSPGGVISKTVGSFPSVSGVTSVTSAAVPEFNNEGILGTKEYSLQLNTDAWSSTSACSGGAPGCTVWQQFIYATDYERKNSAAVFMQYWLLGYRANANSKCPSGYTISDSNCYKNSDYVSTHNVAISDLGNLKLTATAIPSGYDMVTFTNGTQAVSVSAFDSVLHIGTVWRESEFNIVGDAGGSEAVFNWGASIAVNVAAEYGSSAAPTCEAGEGTTGETNNLKLGPCTSVGGATPSIEFQEVAPQPVTCSVFNDGTTAMAGPGDAISSPAHETERACLPGGNCRKWFGNCSGGGMPVGLTAFDDAHTSPTGASGAVFINQEGQACIPDGTGGGACRKWFGLGAAPNGQTVACRVFDDGFTNLTAASGAVYINSAGQACIPDNTPDGTCRKLWGRCELQ